ncbi:hypothetical protein GCM10010269_15770 [Streptomyces humidus]|uniref:Uncharacterized protein n=1 Tax=Streptomyces humidus TaxID=52259 RepID=A0A918FSH5_9ACTN|nr:hypothetical protein [Streptomyces humidus]GGR77346.1 hypothetical protein GCM10010269_15770 [Streptomyces humidus]
MNCGDQRLTYAQLDAWANQLARRLLEPGVTAPILGPRTAEQLENGLAALRVSSDGDRLKELDALFPGPRGPPRRRTPGEAG